MKTKAASGERRPEAAGSAVERKSAPGRQPPSTRSVWIAAGLTSLAALVVYLVTLSPTIVGGDSGELVAAAAAGGLIHPPGYPLYSILSKLFTGLPFGGVATRVNLLSAVCDAAAAGILCRATARWSGNLWSGLLAGLTFALSPLVWPYAITAEVFPLNNLLVAWMVDLSVSAALAASPSGLPRRLLASAGLCVGLGLSNHHTIVFFALPFVVLLGGLGDPALRRPLAWLPFLGGVAAGLLPYLYLPIAAARNPSIAWGNPSTLHGFIAHVTRSEYGTFQLAMNDSGPRGGLWPNLGHFAQWLGLSSFYVVPVLVALGLLTLRRGAERRVLTIAWVAATVFYLIVFASLANLRTSDSVHAAVLSRFWQQPLVPLLALSGVGLAWGARRLPSDLGRLAPAVVALGLPVALGVTRWQVTDQSRNFFFRSYGAAVLGSLPNGATLMITSDEAIGSTRYLQEVEGVRKDVRIVPLGLVVLPWFPRFAERHLPGVVLPPPASGEALTARAFVDANLPHAPVFMLNRVPWLKTLEESAHPWQMGLCEQVLPLGQGPVIDRWIARAEADFGALDWRAAVRPGSGVWERYVAENTWRNMDRYGRQLTAALIPRTGEPAVLKLMVRGLLAVARNHPGPDPAVFKNLGLAYKLLSKDEPRLHDDMLRAWQQYLARKPTQDADYESIRKIVEGSAKVQ